jgi:hypothetical protein
MITDRTDEVTTSITPMASGLLSCELSGRELTHVFSKSGEKNVALTKLRRNSPGEASQDFMGKNFVKGHLEAGFSQWRDVFQGGESRRGKGFDENCFIHFLSAKRRMNARID